MSKTLPAGLMPRAALPLIYEYASGAKGEYKPESLLKAIVQQTTDEWCSEQLEEFGIDFGFTAARAGIGAFAAAGAGALLFAFGGLIFGTTRNCTILLVNDTSVPLTLVGGPHQVSGEQAGAASFPSEPPRLNWIPAATDGAVGFGMWGFQKSTTLGIGFEGSYGWLDFASDPDVLPHGLRVGWGAFQSGHVSCGVSLDTTAAGRPWFDKHVDDHRRQVDIVVEGGAGVGIRGDMKHLAEDLKKAFDGADRAAVCSQSTVNENSTMLVALVRAKSPDEGE